MRAAMLFLKGSRDDWNTSLNLKRKPKFANFIYHKIKIFIGGAYAPYAPCMGTPLVYNAFRLYSVQ